MIDTGFYGLAFKIGGSETEGQELRVNMEGKEEVSEIKIKEDTTKESARKIIQVIVEVAKKIKEDEQWKQRQDQIPVYISWAGPKV